MYEPKKRSSYFRRDFPSLVEEVWKYTDRQDLARPVPGSSDKYLVGPSLRPLGFPWQTREDLYSRSMLNFQEQGYLECACVSKPA